MQRVLVIELRNCIVETDDHLADKNLKLKFRMDGVTHLKTTAQKAKIDVSGRLRRNFRMNKSSCLYEGSSMFNFELCQERIFGSSRTVASCALSDHSVTSILTDGTCGKNWHLELTSVDVPGKVIAHLFVNIQLATTTLQEAGGYHMLMSKLLHIKPVKLQPGSLKITTIEVADSQRFIRSAAQANGHLQQIYHEVQMKKQTHHEKDGMDSTYFPSIAEAEASIDLPSMRSEDLMGSEGDWSNELASKTTA
jgi:hypothetical protein